MVSGYGPRNAEPENTGESSPKTSHGTEAASVPLKIGSFDIDDAIGMHLLSCDQCREYTLRARPVPNIPRVGVRQDDGHCGDYWQLQLMRAKYEGRVNNIVARTEYGDEAPKGKGLE